MHAILPDLGTAEDALHFFKRVVRKDHGCTDLADNPWVMPPEAVVKKGRQATEKYLVDAYEAEKAGAEATILQLLKVVLIGSAEAGTTRCGGLRDTSHAVKYVKPTWHSMLTTKPREQHDVERAPRY